jgi:hypothetical protein
LLDEFEDVSQEEKEIMKLWNRFILEHGHRADSHVTATCIAFAEINAKRCIAFPGIILYLYF